MEPIRSVSPSLPSNVLSVSSQPQQRLNLDQTFPVQNANDPPLAQLQSDLLSQLPQDSAQQVTSIFTDIGITATQSLEPGLGNEDRDSLQNRISEDLLNLQSVFDSLTQESLDLFVAIFQTSFQSGIIESDQDQGPLAAALFFTGLIDNPVQDLFRIDVTTESGSLAALGLTNSIIEVLGGNDSGSNRLESLLGILTDVSSLSSFSDAIEQSGTLEDTSVETIESEANDNAGDDSQNPPPSQEGVNTPTIIDLAG